MTKFVFLAVLVHVCFITGSCLVQLHLLRILLAKREDNYFVSRKKHIIFVNMSLKLLEFLIYLCSGMICFVLGMVLIFVRVGEKVDIHGFRFVLRSIAYAAFLDVLFDVVVIYLQSVKVDYAITNHFFAPLIMYWQLFWGAGSMLTLLRSPKFNLRNVLMLVSPVFILTILYLVAFVRESDSFTLASYAEFIKLGSANFLSKALLGCLLIELTIVGFWLYKEMARYNGLLSDYYTDNKIENGHRVYSIMLAFTIYIITTFYFILSGNVVHRLVVISVNTGLFVVFTIRLINLQYIFKLVSPAFTYNDSPQKTNDVVFTVAGNVNDIVTDYISSRISEADLAKTAASEETDDSSKSDTQDKKSIDEIVKQWSESPDKLFLKEGITLSTAAESMGVSPRLLSDFLNNIYEMNFNTWIKSLRVEEVKCLLKQTEPKKNLLDIAILTGFPDASSMSKAFKLFTGMTPSAYRTSSTGGGRVVKASKIQNIK